MAMNARREMTRSHKIGDIQVRECRKNITFNFTYQVAFRWNFQRFIALENHTEIKQQNETQNPQMIYCLAAP